MRLGQNFAERNVAKATLLNSNPSLPLTDTVEEGFFTVDHDLRLLYVEATPNGRLWANATGSRSGIDGNQNWIGENLWEIFSGPLRPSLFAAYKRLLTGDVNTAWEASLNDVRYTFRTFSVSGGFATYYRAFNQEDVPEEPVEQASTTNTGIWVPPDVDAFFMHSADIMCVLDEHGCFDRINPAAERLLGAEVVAQRRGLLDLVHAEDREGARQVLFAPPALTAHRDNETFALLCRCRSVAGEYRWLQWSIGVASQTYQRQRRFFATARDITLIKNREEEMSRQVNHDPLTGLPNRHLLNDRLEYCLITAGRRRHSVAVLFLDLDRFKKINDTFGHPAGDQLLTEIAERMRSCLRDEDTIARLGGDEFVIILPQVRENRDAIRVAEKLLSRFVQPFYLRGNPVMLSVSIGISISPQDGKSAEELIQHADDAMYRAKNGGRGTYAMYDASVAKPVFNAVVSVEQYNMEARLAQAIQREELLLHYQPQVDLRRDRVIGVEALMRWHPSETEPISPSTFIPLAEETNLIIPLGNWAMHEACRQAVDWYRNGLPVQMSVNLSAAQLTDQRFPENLGNYLTMVGLPPNLMDLELTERTFINNDDRIIEALNRLRDMGIHLSVDDFGTKYSWLPYLRNFPINSVKVDRSFVMNIAENAADEAVVRAIINLSQTLGLKVVAEGVETVAQRDVLLKLGCDIMQGHLFSAAVPPGEVPPMLRRGVR